MIVVHRRGSAVLAGAEVDARADPGDNKSMAEIIDLTLVSEARRCFRDLLKARGVSYFLKKDGRRLFHIEQARVEQVIRTASRARPRHLPRPSPSAMNHCRKEIRRELIRRVVEAMLQTGL